MQPPFNTLIPAAHRRQALDWSLVLASQGIEHRIQQDEATGWVLTVNVADRDRALAQINLYRRENRQWRWRRPLFESGIFFDWSSLAWVLLAVFFYGWSETRADLLAPGEMDGAALAHGEWWRLFTATWLHADPAHLATNVVFGFLFLGLVMGRYGPGVGLLVAYLAGASGNVATWLIHEPTFHGLGASGVVMGALGLFTIQTFAIGKRADGTCFRYLAGAMLAGVLLFVFLGTSPSSDVVAHLGGFIAGLSLGAGLALAPQFIHRTWVNVTAAILFTALVIIPWWLALTVQR